VTTGQNAAARRLSTEQKNLLHAHCSASNLWGVWQDHTISKIAYQQMPS
jgi:hypothetical protein